MKKSSYTRSTRECSFNDMHPKFIQYFHKYLENNRIGWTVADVNYCFETTNLKKGFLGKIQTSYTDICITHNFLFWGIIYDKKDSGIAAARWEDLSEVWNWADTEKGRLFEESGIELYGFIYLFSNRSKWFIGLGNDEAGQKCTQIIMTRIKSDIN